MLISVCYGRISRSTAALLRAWAASQEVIRRRVLLVPEDVSPGPYLVQLGPYRPTGGRRLPVDRAGGRDSLPSAYVEVAR
jgi:hypothetical protein